MNMPAWPQFPAILHLEIWKAFFSKRNLWIYLFAVAPVLLFAANPVHAPRQQARLAVIVIFAASVALQWEALLWQFPHAAVADYFASPTAAHLLSYLGVTVLACAAYGSVFLCAGLLFRNPIVPAAVVLLWESANLFLPATPQKLGVIHYLQSLCPFRRRAGPQHAFAAHALDFRLALRLGADGLELPGSFHAGRAGLLGRPGTETRNQLQHGLNWEFCAMSFMKFLERRRCRLIRNTASSLIFIVCVVV